MLSHYRFAAVARNPFKSQSKPKRRFRALIAILGGFGMGLCLLVQTTAAASNIVRRADVEALLPRIEAHIQETMQAWNTPGLAIGIVAEDELIYAKGFGVREVGGSTPVTPETVFQIGSTTKAFLGVTLAQLVEEGKLSWDDAVIDHDPSFRLADP